MAERRQATTEDIVTTLRLFRDEARAETERARQQTEDMRRLIEAARADTAAWARARSARVLRVHKTRCERTSSGPRTRSHGGSGTG